MFSSLRSVFAKIASRPIAVDLAVGGALIVSGGYLLGQLDLFEAVYDFTRAHEDYELDEFIGVLVTLPLVLLIFALRRLSDLRSEVDKRRQMEDRLLSMARTDPLTGLPNRRYFIEEMERRAERLSRRGTGLALLHLDLDRFKQINDTLGHGAGDHVLSHAAQLIKTTVRREDMVARTGGDEFLIAIDLATGPFEVKTLAGRLIEQIAKPVPYKGRNCRTGASIGIDIHLAGPAVHRLSADRMMMNAGIALFRAKQLGRGRFELFSDELRCEFEAKNSLVDELDAAVRDEQFEPYYQLQFDAKTHDVVAVEALTRWNHPTRGVLDPSAFMAAAEQVRLAGKIDGMILRKAIEDQRSLDFRRLGIGRLSVNVSTQRLDDRGLLATLRDLNPRHGRVALELSEAVLFDTLDAESREQLAAIRYSGVELEIDDFGTGYTSISNLVDIKPHRLKIDRSLMKPLVHQPRQRQVIGAIVEMADALGIRVVADGVESMDHVIVAQTLGCDLVQGDVFARPMPARELAEFIDRQPWRTHEPAAANEQDEPQPTAADLEAPRVASSAP